MKQRNACLYIAMAALLGAVLIVIAFFNVARAEEVYKAPKIGPYYMTQIDKIIDGDTFRGWIQTFIYQSTYASIRIAGIDAPERRAPEDCEKKLAQQSGDYLAYILAAAKTVTIDDLSYDSFGRVVAFVYVDGAEVGALMIKEGFARPYVKGRHGGWCMSG